MTTHRPRAVQPMDIIEFLANASPLQIQRLRARLMNLTPIPTKDAG